MPPIFSGRTVSRRRTPTTLHRAAWCPVSSSESCCWRQSQLATLIRWEVGDHSLDAPGPSVDSDILSPTSLQAAPGTRQPSIALSAQALAAQVCSFVAVCVSAVYRIIYGLRLCFAQKTGRIVAARVNASKLINNVQVLGTFATVLRHTPSSLPEPRKKPSKKSKR